MTYYVRVSISNYYLVVVCVMLPSKWFKVEHA